MHIRTFANRRAPYHNRHVQSKMDHDFEHLLPSNWEKLVQAWLDEDIPGFDVGGYVVGSKEEKALLYGKTDGVLAGRPFFDRVFTLLGCKVCFSRPGAFMSACSRSHARRDIISSIFCKQVHEKDFHS